MLLLCHVPLTEAEPHCSVLHLHFFPFSLWKCINTLVADKPDISEIHETEQAADLRGQNHGHSVVEHTLPEQQRVQVHVHLQLVEDGQDRHWGADRTGWGQSEEQQTLAPQWSCYLLLNYRYMQKFGLLHVKTAEVNISTDSSKCFQNCSMLPKVSTQLPWLTYELQFLGFVITGL